METLDESFFEAFERMVIQVLEERASEVETLERLWALPTRDQ